MARGNNGRLKGRDTATITREEIAQCAKFRYSFTKTSRILNCSYDMLRKFVRENHSDLWDLFVWNGVSNQNNGSKKRDATPEL